MVCVALTALLCGVAFAAPAPVDVTMKKYPAEVVESYRLHMVPGTVNGIQCGDYSRFCFQNPAS